MNERRQIMLSTFRPASRIEHLPIRTSTEEDRADFDSTISHVAVCVTMWHGGSSVMDAVARDSQGATTGPTVHGLDDYHVL